MQSRPNFVAWDGEGTNNEDPSTWLWPDGIPRTPEFATKPQGYTLLMCKAVGSAAASIAETDVAGLSTRACFDFLLDQAAKHPGKVHVIYSGNYDVNMMLRDVPIPFLKLLHEDSDKNKPTRWLHYGIKYLPRKLLWIKNYQTGQSMQLWDVLGFFQGSFVKTMKDWLTSEEWIARRTFISQMKDKRSDLAAETWADVLRYCEMELDGLLAIMGEFSAALEQAEIPLSSWHGAGAVASALFKKYSVPSGRDLAFSSGLYEAIRCAYAGGRIEAPYYGLHEGTVYHYDINSAYPSQMARLQDRSAGEWQHNTEQYTDFALYRLSWRFPDTLPWYPFFYRAGSSIFFPYTGAGWYWSAELEAAMDYCTALGLDWHDHIMLHEWYAFVPAGHNRPLDFVPDIYWQRQQWVKEGFAAEKVLKLGLNSLYGKMAQQQGWKEHDGKLIIPRFHNLAWAGYVTAGTRAQLVRTACYRAADIVSFQTDGIYSLSPLSLEVDRAKTLGGWSGDTCDGILQVQPGVYFVLEQREWKENSRGYERGSIQRDEVIDLYRHAWRPDVTELIYPARVKRFVTYGSVLQSAEQQKYWRTFKTSRRDLDLLPTGKRNSKAGLPVSPGPGYALVPSEAARVPRADWEIATIAGDLTGNFADMPLSDPFTLDWEGAYLAETLFEGIDPRTIIQESEDME